MILLRRLIPAFVLCFSWLLVVVVRNNGLIFFDPIGSHAGLVLFSFFLCSFVGISLGALFPVTRGAERIYSFRSVNRKVNWLILFSLISIIFSLFKLYIFLGFDDVSLSSITEHRLERARSGEDVKGGSFFGVISNITSGFFVATYVFGLYFKNYLTLSKRRFILLVFIAGVGCSFLGGGRFTAALSIMFVSFFVLCSLLMQRPGPVDYRHPLKYGAVYKIIFVMGVLFLFSYLFVERFNASGRGGDMLLYYINNDLPGVSVPDGVASLLSDYPFLEIPYFVVSMFLYYIGHAFYQFSVLLQYGMPRSAPYNLAYQFYPFVLMMNKVGFEIISIQAIIDEIPNAGNYFTLVGSFYLDFGIIGTFFAVFFVFFCGGVIWANMLRKKTFLFAYFSSMFMLVLFFSPIVGVLGTAIFPSLIIVSLLLWFFVPAGTTVRVS